MQNIVNIQHSLYPNNASSLGEKIFTSEGSRKINLHHSKPEIIHLVPRPPQENYSCIRKLWLREAEQKLLAKPWKIRALDVKKFPESLKLLDCSNTNTRSVCLFVVCLYKIQGTTNKILKIPQDLEDQRAGQNHQRFLHGNMWQLLYFLSSVQTKHPEPQQYILQKHI